MHDFIRGLYGLYKRDILRNETLILNLRDIIKLEDTKTRVFYLRKLKREGKLKYKFQDNNVSKVEYNLMPNNNLVAVTAANHNHCRNPGCPIPFPQKDGICAFCKLSKLLLVQSIISFNVDVSGMTPQEINEYAKEVYDIAPDLPYYLIFFIMSISSFHLLNYLLAKIRTFIVNYIHQHPELNQNREFRNFVGVVRHIIPEIRNVQVVDDQNRIFAGFGDGSDDENDEDDLGMNDIVRHRENIVAVQNERNDRDLYLDFIRKCRINSEPNNVLLYIQSLINEKQFTTMIDDNEENKECRLCFEEFNNGMNAIRPCHCSGSIAYVHKECLGQLIFFKLRNGRQTADTLFRCPTCLHSYLNL